MTTTRMSLTTLTDQDLVSEVKRLAIGPEVSPSTFSASATVSTATRWEWFDVVGSRCS